MMQDRTKITAATKAETTIPVKANGLTPPLSKHLGSMDLAKHRTVLCVHLEVLAKKFDRFGWDRDRGSMAHDLLLMDWMDALQDYPVEEVQAACRAAVHANPNKMPNEGHVKAQIISARAKVIAARPRTIEPSMDRQPVDKKTANEILADAGFAPRRMNDVAAE